MKSRKVILFILMIALFTVAVFSSFSNIYAKEQPIVDLTYHIDTKNHRVVFDPGKITIAVGQIVSIKSPDLIFGGNFINNLDFDWQLFLHNNLEVYQYYFRGVGAGKSKIQCIYTKNSSITGGVEITIVGDNQQPRIASNLRKVYYRIDPKVSNYDEQEAIIFTDKRVTLGIGQELIIMPKDNTVNGNIITELDNSDAIEENSVFDTKGHDLSIFKAKAVGKAKIEYHIAHEYFLKGTIEITVTDRPGKIDNAIPVLIGDYEKLMVKAVNQNDFSIVAGSLTPGSNLYQSQQNLVFNLNKQKIQEQLLGYQIQDIQPTEEDGTYKVYVHEKIGIQYPDKPGLKTLEFDWIYTVETQGGKMGLSGIEKWVRS
ncbi:MAG TPA: hypothetical protein DDW50_03080 [Firmicutes bacterium]|nr:hypothetical protein [Bacillota bacterium]